MKLKVLAPIAWFFVLLFSEPLYCQVKLPRLISDGMVLQRETKLNIWGWASPKEKVVVTFKDKLYDATTGQDGKWSVSLPPMDAGGPYTMDIQASNHITVKNILVGDVWICSGQSNMELPIYRVAVAYPGLVESSENSNIRHFAVSTTYRFKDEATDFSTGTWLEANPENVLGFSAVGYFFARTLYEKYKFPIGLIRIAVGGSPAEAWLSETAIKEYPEYFKTLELYKNEAVVDSIINHDKKIVSSWNQNIDMHDKGLTGPVKWFDDRHSFSDWKSIEVPGFWESNLFVMNEKEQHENISGTNKANGVVWFKKEIQLDESNLNKPTKLVLGAIVDRDEVYVNGELVGSTGYRYPPRRYDVPANLLKKGKNIITVRVVSNSGNGGFVPDKFYGIVFDEDTLRLDGEWQYEVGYSSDPMPGGQVTFHYQPSSLFNAMVAPVLNYKIKGVIWYQGESNTNDPQEYTYLFKHIITDWRKNFNQGNFSFLYVQLANFMEVKDQPMESNWAELREAQLKALTIPNTGMAVAIDIGEWNDIHPLNKKDVGKRLALAAQKIAYGENVVHSGPIYQSMKIIGKKAVLSFTNTGSGLLAKGDKDLKSFAIAGEDGKFVWAKAIIEGDKVVVWNDQVLNPVAVRYAWADNPKEANLYNKEGLPASPFRTDK